MSRCLAVIVAALVLAACRAEPVVVGSKESMENRILAEMFAHLLEDAGLPVERRLGLGDSPEAFAAIRGGTIDLYPEYTGTALGLLGAPPTPDAAAALATARAGFSPLGLAFLDPLGFQSTYAVVTRRTLAERLDLARVSDLAEHARRLRLGVSEAFADRPADGLQPFLDRFGLDFADVAILTDRARETLYGELIDGRVDVIVGFSTDPEIGDYGLVQLPADRPFFPAYEAVPLVDEAALSRAPAIAEALAPLAGRITPELMRDFVRQAQVFGRPPAAVAADALAYLEIGEGAPGTPLPTFRIAADLRLLGPSLSTRVLRAVREAVPGREVALMATEDPLAAVATREARVAIVPALSLFAEGEGDMLPRDGFEAIAVTGTTYVHALARRDGPDSLEASGSIATGPPGTPATQLARAVEAVSERAPGLVALDDTRPETVVAALAEGVAEAGLVLGVRGLPALGAALSGAEALRLVDGASWWRGPARLALPFLREAVIPAGTYDRQGEPISTLAMQTVLVGPAPPRERTIGIMGPGTFAEGVRPLADATVLAIHAALGEPPDVGPHLPAARALQPRAVAETGLPRRPDEALLAIAILAFLAFGGWLFLRRSGET